MQFGKRMLYIALCLKLFTNIVDQLSLKNVWLPTVHFLDFNNTWLRSASPAYSYTTQKNTFEVLGTVLKYAIGK